MILEIASTPTSSFDSYKNDYVDDQELIWFDHHQDDHGHKHDLPADQAV